jgi:hypothetical protein
VEQALLTLPENLRSPQPFVFHIFSVIRFDEHILFTLSEE